MAKIFSMRVKKPKKKLLKQGENNTEAQMSFSGYKVKDKEANSSLALNTPEGARSFDKNASSGAKVQQNSETANESEGNLLHVG